MLVLKLFTLLFTIDTERINSLCMWKGDCLSMWKGNCLCVWKDDCLCVWKGDHLSWSWRIHNWQRGSIVNFHFHGKRWLPLLILGEDQWLTKRGSTVNFHIHVKRQLPLLILRGKSMIDKERINSQLALLHEEVVASVDPGGGLDWWPTQRGSTVNFHHFSCTIQKI